MSLPDRRKLVQLLLPRTQLPLRVWRGMALLGHLHLPSAVVVRNRVFLHRNRQGQDGRRVVRVGVVCEVNGAELVSHQILYISLYETLDVGRLMSMLSVPNSVL